MYSKILIVDDEPLMRNTIKQLLPWESYGFTICGEAADGKAALILIEKFLPDIVFTDIVMPGTDGLELLKSIKLRFPHMSVIMLSSYDQFSFVQRALQFGAIDYILKPTLDSAQMLNFLRHLFPDKITSKVIPSNHNRHYHIKAMFDGVKPPHNFSLVQNMTVAFILTEHINVHARIEVHQKLLQVFTDNNFDQISQPNAEVYIFYSDSAALLAESFFFENNIMGAVIANIKDTSQLFTLCTELDYIKEFPFFMPACHIYIANAEELLPLNKKSPMQYKELNNIASLSDLMLLLQNITFKDCITSQHLKLLTETVLYNYFTKAQMAYNHSLKDEESKNDIFEHITFSENIDELRKIYSDVYHVLIYRVQNNNENSHMDEIIHYVEENYMENISLNDIADYLHFNYSYISSYFNSKSEINFKEYLNNFRIDKAKQLLTQGNKNISEICFSVGFTDHAYFSRVFRKITGLTPSDYKKNLKG